MQQQTVSNSALIREMNSCELEQYADTLYRKKYAQSINDRERKELVLCEQAYGQLTGRALELTLFPSSIHFQDWQ